LDFARRVNHKKLSGGSGKTRRLRDQQFRYMEGIRAAFAGAGAPVINVDSKKKELIGCFNLKTPVGNWR
jgi:hypothetical protein